MDARKLSLVDRILSRSGQAGKKHRCRTKGIPFPIPVSTVEYMVIYTLRQLRASSPSKQNTLPAAITHDPLMPSTHASAPR